MTDYFFLKSFINRIPIQIEAIPIVPTPSPTRKESPCFICINPKPRRIKITAIANCLSTAFHEYNKIKVCKNSIFTCSDHFY